MRLSIIVFCAVLFSGINLYSAGTQVMPNSSQTVVSDGSTTNQLQDAIIFGNLKELRYLKEHSLVDLEVLLSNSGITALGLAVQNNQAEVVQSLIGYGVKVDKPSNGIRPLILAIILGRMEIIKILLASGADPNPSFADPKEGSPIETAIKAFNDSACKLLIQANAKLSPEYLFYAVGCNSPKIAKMLIENGVHDEIDSISGRTALMLAAQMGNSELFYILLDGNSDPHSIGKFSNTLLIYGVLGRNIEIISTLIERGVALDKQQMPSGFTALNLAIVSGANNIAELLIAKKANLLLKTESGITPFANCAILGNYEIAKLLIQNGTSVDDVFTYGENIYCSMIAAIGSNNKALVQLIAERTKLINFKDSAEGNTALIFASQLGNKDMVSILLKYGATISIKNNQNKTAIDLAKNKEIASLLKNWKK